MKPILSVAAQAEIENIACTILHADNLATRNSDSLDFHDVVVGNLRAALEAAHLAGVFKPTPVVTFNCVKSNI